MSELTELRRQLDLALDGQLDRETLTALEDLTERSVELVEEKPASAGALATDLIDVYEWTNPQALTRAGATVGKPQSVRSIRRRSAEALAGIAAETSETPR